MKEKYRLMLGRKHKLTLIVQNKERVLSFEADGQERHMTKIRAAKALGEIEVRPWNRPIILKKLVIEGVLKNR